MVGAELKQQGYSTVIYNFASPRVGNKAFCNIINSMDVKIFRIVNTADVIPTLPLSVSPNYTKGNANYPVMYAHCGELKNIYG